MDYPMTNPKSITSSVSATYMVGNFVASTVICEEGFSSTDACLTRAIVNNDFSWSENNYSSSVELNAQQSFGKKLQDVRNLYLEVICDIFPSLATRLKSLANAEDGWDGRDACSMSFESFGQFRKFLLKTELFADDIGLYLDDDGALILSYTDSNHGLVDLTFHAQVIEVCSDEFEKELTLDEAVKFIKSES